MPDETRPWHVYMLRCADGSYYVGVATDLAERLAEHNAGHGSAHTRRRRPVQLIWHEQHASFALARAREAQLKGWSRAKKEWLARGCPRG
ncbi:MAG: GIY-YIG nuclease family protein [Armatimonadetes bacterium]|nr:GIY-YIG nuclease family protein [Armatimonadota bacterium]